MDDFLERRRGPIIGALLLIITAGLTVLYSRWPRTPADMGSLRAPRSDSALITTVQRNVTVHVTGAVVNPGVYTLPDGARVDDAIKAAGGATADGDVSRLNLAQRLRDEGYIVVPPKSVAGVSESAAPTSSAALLNINTATRAQLEALPGIGATYAQRIVDYRANNGPYQKTSDLVTFKLIPQATFDKVKNLIDVK